jgi:hypothetical protein
MHVSPTVSTIHIRDLRGQTSESTRLPKHREHAGRRLPHGERRMLWIGTAVTLSRVLLH